MFFHFQIAKTTLSSKILAQHKDFFSNLAVDAVLRLKGSGNLDAIQIIKKQGGTLGDSFLDEGNFFLHVIWYMYEYYSCYIIFIFIINISYKSLMK